MRRFGTNLLVTIAIYLKQAISLSICSLLTRRTEQRHDSRFTVCWACAIRTADSERRRVMTLTWRESSRTGDGTSALVCIESRLRAYTQTRLGSEWAETR